MFVAVQIAGNAGVPPDKAGLAGALITASFQVGVALGLAILSALATAGRTRCCPRTAPSRTHWSAATRGRCWRPPSSRGAVALIGLRGRLHRD